MLKFNTWYYSEDYSKYYVMWIDIERSGYYGWVHRDGTLRDLSDGKPGPEKAEMFMDVSGVPIREKEPKLTNKQLKLMVKDLFEVLR